MNTDSVHNYVEAHIVIANELRQGLLETSNADELAGDVLNALEYAGWTLSREAEQCRQLTSRGGFRRLERCVLSDGHGGEHHFLPVLSVKMNETHVKVVP